jgi:flagellin
MTNSIISNTSAFNAQGNINTASDKAASSIARLSSGNRIVRASDDVAGLATGTALRTQVTTLRTALSNASQGSSLLQVADGALGQIIDILQRQKAIAAQAASGQLTDANRALLNQEFTALTAEVDRIATGTNFNGVQLLAGGLGQKSVLVRTDALAGTAFVAAPTLGGATVTPSTTSIQAFNTQTGTTLSSAAAGVRGHMFLSNSTGTVLANDAFLNVDGSVYGQFSDFEFSNINFGATTTGSADLTATINGVKFTGNVIGNTGNVSATLQNGTTYIRVGLGAVDFTNSSTTEFTRAGIEGAFRTTTIARVNTLNGIDFTGTALEGITGTATTGLGTIRLTTNGSVDIGNFQYVSNGGAVDTNNLTVQINGKTFTATNVDDQIVAGGNLVFSDEGEVQALMINTTGLALAISNIRTSETDRAAFINALNVGFSRAGGGLNFTVGSTSSDNIRVQLGSATTVSIYNGNTLSINTAQNAQVASTVLDNAIVKTVSLRATVGGLQSRFEYASNAIQSAIENQDSARSVFLDTDVSAESTAYASAQVQLQAGISVLAQANQLPQALLKLIG